MVQLILNYQDWNKFTNSMEIFLVLFLSSWISVARPQDTTESSSQGGPYILKMPGNQTVMDGQRVEIECKAEGFPSIINHKWMKDGDNLDNSNGYKVGRLKITEEGSLLITSAIKTDTGWYTCEPSNDLGSERASAYINVIYKPVVMSMPSQITWARGHHQKLDCPVLANPQVTEILWYKDQTSIQEAGRYSILDNGTLLVHDVKHSDAGAYKCTPSNKLGPGLSSPRVQVLVKDPPTFVSRPDAMYQRKLGQMVTMKCEAAGTPQPTIEWKKDSRVLDLSNSRITKFPNRLEITDLRKQDHGRYECLAGNSINTVVTVTELRILETSPHAPYNVTVIPGLFDVRISWELGFNGGDSTSFHVLWFKEVSDEKWETMNVDPKATSYSLHGLQADTEYVFKILSRNRHGAGTFSKSAHAKTLGYHRDLVTALPRDANGVTYYPNINENIGPRPSAPYNLTASVQDREIYLRWLVPRSTPVEIFYYRIEYSKDNSKWSQHDAIIRGSKTNVYYLGNMLKGTYDLQVRAYGVLAYSATSNVARVVVDDDDLVLPDALIGGIIGGILFLLVAVLLALVAIFHSRKKDRKAKAKKFNDVSYGKPDEMNGRSFEHPAQRDRWQQNGGGNFVTAPSADNSSGVFFLPHTPHSTNTRASFLLAEGRQHSHHGDGIGGGSGTDRRAVSSATGSGNERRLQTRSAVSASGGHAPPPPPYLVPLNADDLWRGETNFNYYNRGGGGGGERGQGVTGGDGGIGGSRSRSQPNSLRYRGDFSPEVSTAAGRSRSHPGSPPGIAYDPSSRHQQQQQQQHYHRYPHHQRDPTHHHHNPLLSEDPTSPLPSSSNAAYFPKSHSFPSQRLAGEQQDHPHRYHPPLPPQDHSSYPQPPNSSDRPSRALLRRQPPSLPHPFSGDQTLLSQPSFQSEDDDVFNTSGVSVSRRPHSAPSPATAAGIGTSTNHHPHAPPPRPPPPPFPRHSSMLPGSRPAFGAEDISSVLDRSSDQPSQLGRPLSSSHPHPHPSLPSKAHPSSSSSFSPSSPHYPPPPQDHRMGAPSTPYSSYNNRPLSDSFQGQTDARDGRPPRTETAHLDPPPQPRFRSPSDNESSASSGRPLGYTRDHLQGAIQKLRESHGHDQPPRYHGYPPNDLSSRSDPLTRSRPDLSDPDFGLGFAKPRQPLSSSHPQMPRPEDYHHHDHHPHHHHLPHHPLSRRESRSSGRSRRLPGALPSAPDGRRRLSSYDDDDPRRPRAHSDGSRGMRSSPPVAESARNGTGASAPDIASPSSWRGDNRYHHPPPHQPGRGDDDNLYSPRYRPDHSSSSPYGRPQDHQQPSSSSYFPSSHPLPAVNPSGRDSYSGDAAGSGSKPPFPNSASSRTGFDMAPAYHSASHFPPPLPSSSTHHHHHHPPPAPPSAPSHPQPQPHPRHFDSTTTSSGLGSRNTSQSTAGTFHHPSRRGSSSVGKGSTSFSSGGLDPDLSLDTTGVAGVGSGGPGSHRRDTSADENYEFDSINALESDIIDDLRRYSRLSGSAGGSHHLPSLHPPHHPHHHHQHQHQDPSLPPSRSDYSSQMAPSESSDTPFISSLSRPAQPGQYQDSEKRFERLREEFKQYRQQQQQEQQQQHNYPPFSMTSTSLGNAVEPLYPMDSEML